MYSFVTHFICITPFISVTHFISATPSLIQPFGNRSVDGLCLLAKHLGIGYCAKIFKAKDFDGEEFIFTPESEFFSMLKNEGYVNTGGLSFGGC